MKAVKWVIYASVVLAAIGLPIAIFTTRSAFGFWFGIVPVFCIVFLDATKAKVLFSWGLLLEDLRRSVKFLASLAAYNVFLCLVVAYLLRSSGINLGLHLSFAFGNIVEEIFFRATLIPLFELLEQRLFDSVNQVRVVGVTSVAFGLCHVGQVLNASIPVVRYIAIQNVLLATVGGVFLGNLYSRSRNLPSTIAIHWWINLQNQVLQAIASSLFA